MQSYGALFVETEAKAAEESEEGSEEGEEEELAESADYSVIYAEGEEDETGEEGEEEEPTEETTPAVTYNALDPLFGAIKYWSNKLLNKEISLGDSPMYDAMIATYEVGMTDSIAPYIILAMPIALIIYVT